MINKKSGFTLVEVIVAMLVLAAALGGFLCSFLFGKDQVERAGRYSSGLGYAVETLEQYRNAIDGNYWPPTVVPYLENANPKGDLSAGNHNHDISGTELAINFGGSRIYTVTNIDIAGGGGAVDYKQITVTVDWNEP